MQNVHPEEIEKFSALASQWWDPLGQFKSLHDINPLRIQWIIDQLGRPLSGLRLLDVGCGGGILAEGLAKAGAQVTGIDLAQKSLMVAQAHAQAQALSIDYQCISAEAFAQAHAEQFDVVTCMEMLEHVPDPGAIVRACAQCVKPGGWVLLSTLNRHPKAWALAIVAAEYLLHMVPKGTHHYQGFIRPHELLQHCHTAGLYPVRTQGMQYLPFTGQYRLSNDVGINYFLAARKYD